MQSALKNNAHNFGSETLLAALEAVGFRCLARMKETAVAADIAFETRQGPLIIRSARHPAASDYAALSTMLAEGPFTRAILIYSEKEGSALSDEIETWWIGDIEELVARLAAEAAA